MLDQDNSQAISVHCKLFMNSVMLVSQEKNDEGNQLAEVQYDPSKLKLTNVHTPFIEVSCPHMSQFLFNMQR